MITKPKEKKFPFEPSLPILKIIIKSGFGILLINWVFQGMRGMQKKELLFRIVFELICTSVILLIFIAQDVHLARSFLYALVITHTCNWLLNTHLWVCVRYMKFYRRDPDALSQFLEKVSLELQSKPWIIEAVCIGSVGDKKEISTWRSDIDLRIFFTRGVMNYIRLNLYLIYLRTWALITVIPLDLYAYDDIDILSRFKADEGILLIKDRNDRIKHMYADRVSSGIK